ncbi:MAG: DUF4091 domain-containing protein [Candidatus Coatesbacteria bacterium]|nr:MAG: DUF4091 domain-containing protein [Candidatus Coatesbacteria bacterium]
MCPHRGLSLRTLTLTFLLFSTAALLGCGGGSGLEKINPYTQFRGVTFADDFRVWAVGYLEKVPRDAKYESSNYIFDDGRVRLFAARGETECFHLVVGADFGNLDDVEVEFGEFAGPGGAVIPAENVSLYFEYYVTLQNPSDAYGWAGEVADPLIPLSDEFDLARATCQPIFVRIEVPEDAVPGTYTADAVVSAKGAGSQTVTVELEVFNFTLTEHLPPVFAVVDPRIVGPWHGLDPLNDDTTGIAKEYEDLLVSRGVTPLLFSYPGLANTKSAASAAGEWAKRVSKTAERNGLPALVIPLSASADGSAPEISAANEDYRRLMGALEAKNVEIPPDVYLWCSFDGGSAQPFVDGTAAKWWHGLAEASGTWEGSPAVMAVASPLRAATPALELKGAVSAWVAPLPDIALDPDRFYHLPESEHAFLNLTSAGADVIDARGAVAVLTAWYGFIADCKGMVVPPPDPELFAPTNPWLDDPMVADGRYFGNGMAALFYPGGPVDSKEPISSLRLELLQQAAEEWAYLRMLEEKQGPEYVVERLYSKLPLGKPIRGLSQRDITASEIFDVRRSAAEELAGGKRVGAPVTTSGVVTDRKGKAIPGVWIGDAEFGMYTDTTGHFELNNAAASGGYLTVLRSGYQFDEIPAGGSGVRVGLYRGLQGITKAYDFEMGINPAYWMTGEEEDALMVAEESEFVYEGGRSVEIEFPTGRWSRVVNLYPKERSLDDYHRIETAIYNPNDFAVDVYLILLDDIDLDIEDQYLHPISLRPKSWTNVSLRTRDIEKVHRYEFGRSPGGKYHIVRSYDLDLSDVIGFGIGCNGLSEYGAPEGGSFKIYLDDVFVLKFM